MKRLMENKKHLIISSLLIILPSLIGLLLWDKLPEKIPTHFNFSGEADQFSSKTFMVFFSPLLFLLIHLFLACMISIDPKNNKVSDKIYIMILYSMSLFSLFVHTSIYYKTFHNNFDISKAILFLAALIFIVIGNYLPKTRQNYTIGIKCPWTLEDEDNWNKTHRLAGYLFVGGGLLIAIISFFPKKIMVITFIITVISMTIIPFIYSYSLYRKKHTS